MLIWRLITYFHYYVKIYLIIILANLGTTLQLMKEGKSTVKMVILILHWFLTSLNPDKKESRTHFSFQKGSSVLQLKGWELKIQAGTSVVNLRFPWLLNSGFLSLSSQRQTITNNRVTQMKSDSTDHAIRPFAQTSSKRVLWIRNNLMKTKFLSETQRPPALLSIN